MTVHCVGKDPDDDCNGYTEVEDGISEWNLRWRPRTARNGTCNEYRGNPDQEHCRSPKLGGYD